MILHIHMSAILINKNHLSLFPFPTETFKLRSQYLVLVRKPFCFNQNRWNKNNDKAMEKSNKKVHALGSYD